MPINLETLQIQFEIRDNTGSKIKAIETKLSGVKAKTLEIDADTTEADNALEKIKKKTTSLPDGGINVEASTAAAIKGLDNVAKKAEEIPDAPKIKPDVDTTDATTKLNKLIDLMKTAGLIKIGEKVSDFALQTLDAAYEAKSARNRLEILGNKNASDAIKGYAAQLKEQYGFSETGTIDMTTRYASAYYGIGVPLEEAAKYATELTGLVIDYASALDKTPGEVGSIVDALFRGQVATLDNLGIMGATIDRAEEIAKEMQESGDIPANIEENNLRYFGMLKMLKDNAITKGYVGDWERTYGEYGNQVTIIGDRWKELKEKIGEFLLPAATDIATGLNTILAAIDNFIEKSGNSSFVNQLDQFFGDYTISTAKIDELVKSVTEPIDKMTASINSSNSALGGATNNLKTAYQTFIHLLDFGQGTGNLGEEDVEKSADALIENAQKVLDVGEQNMMDRLNAFTDGVVNEGIAEMYGIIDSYFEQAQEHLDERKKALNDSIEAWKKAPTYENLDAVKNAAWALTKDTYDSATAYMSAEEYRYLSSAYKGGIPDAASIEALMKGMQDASSARRAETDAALEAFRLDFLAMGQSVYNPGTGKNYTVQELDDYFRENVEITADAKMQQMQERQADMLATILYPAFADALANIGEKVYETPGEVGNVDTYARELYAQLEPVMALFPADGSQTESMRRLMALYEGLPYLFTSESFEGTIMQEYQRMVDAGEVSATSSDTVTAELMVAYITDLIDQISNPVEEMTSPAEDLKEASGNLASAIESIPEKIEVTARLSIGGHEFVQMINEEQANYNRSTG